MARSGTRTRGQWRSPHAGETLSAYVSAARRDRGTTWDDLVRATGLSLGTVRKIEEGRTSNPGVFTLLKLWRALDLPVEGLVVLEQSISRQCVSE